MSLRPYQYVVLRCVPRVDREEFANVGVVVFCQDDDYLGVAWHLDEDRLRAFAPSLDLASLRLAVSTVHDVCAGARAGGAAAGVSLSQRFGFIKAPRSTVLQPGPVHGGVTEDPAATLESLADRLVR